MNNESKGILNLVNGLVIEIGLNERSIRGSYLSGSLICNHIELEEYLDIIQNKFYLDLSSIDANDIVNWAFNPADSGVITVDISKMDGSRSTYKLTKSIAENKEIAFILAERLVNETLYSLLDPMTNLYQKESFKSLVGTACEEGNPFSLLIIDIDDFKKINDSMGHMFGDLVIQEIAQYLKTFFKDGYVSRFGGDEFAILTYGSVDYDDVWQKLHTVCKYVEVSRKTNPTFKDVSITVGTSRFGIDGTTYDELFLKADKALYRGKAKGKNCFIIYKHEMHKDINIGGDVDTKAYMTNPEIEYQVFFDVYEVLSRVDYNFDKSIEKTLNILCKFFGTDRVILYTNENGEFSLTKWFTNKAHGVSTIDVVQKNFNNIDMWRQHMEDNYCQMSYVGNVEFLNHEIYENLTSQNVISVVFIELKRLGKVIGYLRFDMCVDRRRWTLKELYLMRALAKILTSFIARYK